MIVVGVDGGGTKTIAVAADLSGHVRARAEGSGSNPNFVGREAAFSVLRHVLDEVRRCMAARNPEPLAHAALCVPGLPAYRAGGAEALGLPPDRASFNTDVDSTFCGALGKETGVVALAGTGSFVTGTNRDGITARAGGWGPIIGDEGSGQRIAVRALQAVALQWDGRGPITRLTNKLLRFYDAATPHELKSAVKLDNVSRLTYLVREAADEGDSIAKAIMADAGRSLADMAASVVERLDMRSDVFELALTGGLPRIGERYTQPFAERLAEHCPAVRLVEPLLPPVGGALLLALRSSGVSWSADVLDALRRTL
ncbi:MAG: N-acetylglucosamine kinase [Paenibacillus sp.]|nr:N-acetylglucosamine kinase [Paenibacillus sp.]